MANNLSPLRYPGGKATLAPIIKFIINNKVDYKINTYIEPFAGGAGVALDLLMNGVVNDIIINDYDKAIYSFWKSILIDTKKFIELINKTEISIDEWHKQKNIYVTKKSKYSLELGFATFFLNRTNRSGILSAGPIGGYGQNGSYLLDARFNKDVLIERIETISQYKNHIKVYNKDIRSFIKLVLCKHPKGVFTYFDPPYYSKGKELYKNHFQIEDHIELCELISKTVNTPWIITYDDEKCIADIYNNYHVERYNLMYSLANKGQSSELIIFSDDKYCPTNDELETMKIKTRFL